MAIILLAIHIVFGSTCLLAAMGALAVTKGEYWHRSFGKLFFYAMTGVFLTAIPLAFIFKNLFLILIAIFSYYLAFTGRRFAQNRSGIATSVDWFVIIVMILTSITMLTIGCFHYASGSYESITLMIFGMIGLISSIGDFISYRKNQISGRVRIVKHLTAMLGAFIAALTAFSVTNLYISPPLILWLGPTIIMLPVIFYWQHRVKKHGL